MGTENWRLLDIEFEDPNMNLSTEEAIFLNVCKGSSPGTLRLWTNPKPVVVLGRFQCLEREVDTEACSRYGAVITRRFTGGGAVYHDKGNLNYAISLSDDHQELGSCDTLQLVSEAVIDGLVEIGISGKLVHNRSIQVHGRKVCGFAGAKKRGGVFCHGTLLVSSDLVILSETLENTKPPTPAKSRYTPSIHSEVTTLEKELQRTLPMSRVKEALKCGFARAFKASLMQGCLTPDESLLSQQLLESKYSTQNWVFGDS